VMKLVKSTAIGLVLAAIPAMLETN
jgi:hypothetical protein